MRFFVVWLVALLFCTLGCRSGTSGRLDNEPDFRAEIARQISAYAECAEDDNAPNLLFTEAEWNIEIDSVLLLARYDVVNPEGVQSRQRLLWVSYRTNGIRRWAVVHLQNPGRTSEWDVPNGFIFDAPCQVFGICCFDERPRIDAGYEARVTWDVRTRNRGPKEKVFRPPSSKGPTVHGWTVERDTVNLDAWRIAFGQTPVIRDAVNLDSR